MSNITDEQYKEAFDNLYDYEKEIEAHNDWVLKSMGATAFSDFQNLIEDCRVINKIEFVDEPKGTNQDESYGVFKNVHVDQHSVGDSGDSYAGHIYANVHGRWIEIYYEC